MEKEFSELATMLNEISVDTNITDRNMWHPSSDTCSAFWVTHDEGKMSRTGYRAGIKN